MGSSTPQVGLAIKQVHLPDSGASTCLKLTPLTLKSQLEFPRFGGFFCFVLFSNDEIVLTHIWHLDVPSSLTPSILKYTQLIYYTEEDKKIIRHYNHINASLALTKTYWGPRMPLFAGLMRCFPFNNYFKLFQNDWNNYSSGKALQNFLPSRVWLQHNGFHLSMVFVIIHIQMRCHITDWAKGRTVPWHS